jgi:hypothetical protein
MEQEEAAKRLDDAYRQVHDRESFLGFVDALRHDLDDAKAKERANPSNPYGRGWNNWENPALEWFLGAALAWARDRPIPEEPSWRSFADFLYAGKVYE